MEFLHSLLRYLVIFAVAYAGLAHLVGIALQRPIMNTHRMGAIVAVVLCHVQLVVGLVIYLQKETYKMDASGAIGRFWKYEHVATMVLAIALVTLGRALSKRAKFQQAKQLRVAVFFLIALALILWATPWPFTTMGHNRTWL